VTRVAREVGTEQLATGPGARVAGTGRISRHVNSMANNLTPRSAISPTDHAGARGDLSRKITVDVKGEILESRHIKHHGGQLALLRRGNRVGAEVGTRASSAARPSSQARRHWKRSHGQRHSMRPTYRPSPEYRQCGTALQWAIFQEDHSDVKANSGTQGNHSHDGPISSMASPRSHSGAASAPEGKLAVSPGAVVSRTGRSHGQRHSMSSNLTPQSATSPRGDAMRARRPFQQDHGWICKARSFSSRRTMTPMSISAIPSPRKSARVARESRTRQARRTGQCPTWPALEDPRDNVEPPMANNLHAQVRNIAQV